MLKRLLQSCAAAALMASSALAANTGTFSTQTADGELVVELHQVQTSVIGGAIHHANRDYRLIAIEDGDQLTGHWESDNKNVAFTGSIDGQIMTLETNGETYTLEKTADATPSPANTQVRSNVERTTSQPAEPRLETREGRAFRYAVADGWAGKEVENGVVLTSRDGIGRVGHTFFFNPVNTRAQAVFQFLLSQAGTQNWTDVKIESSKPGNQDGTPEMTYQLSYKCNGTPVHGTMVVVVYNEAKRSIARVVLLQETPEAFGREQSTMLAMAQEVEVTHGELVDPDLRRQQPHQQQREAGQLDHSPMPQEGEEKPAEEPAGPPPEAGPREVMDQIEAVIREQSDPPPPPEP